MNLNLFLLSETEPGAPITKTLTPRPRTCPALLSEKHLRVLFLHSISGPVAFPGRRQCILGTDTSDKNAMFCKRGRDNAELPLTFQPSSPQKARLRETARQRKRPGSNMQTQPYLASWPKQTQGFCRNLTQQTQSKKYIGGHTQRPDNRK